MTRRRTPTPHAGLRRRLPLLTWLPGYTRATAHRDVVAGVTTAVMLIPQAMAYAMLAGLPPIVGLYAATVPLVLYALFGTSRQLAVGPVAMVSLLVASGVGALAPAGGAEYVALAVALAAIVGVIQLGMGVARVGFLVNFLAHPVISGFTSAAALIIGLSQLGPLLGVSLPRGAVHETVIAAVRSVGVVDLTTLGLGLASIVGLLVLRRRWPRAPGALIVVGLASAAVMGLGLDVAIVGEVPAGLPPLAVPEVTWEQARALLPTALAISLVGFMESVSVGRAFARKERYEIDADQELIGLGLANVAAGLCAGYPVTGGFSRTAVNAQAGARTTLAGVVAAVVVVATLLLLTPLFYYLPRATLAAIIMVAVVGLVDVREVRHLYKVHRGDLGLLALTFVGTLALGIEEGILLGVGVSLLVFVVRTTRPHFAVLGRLPGTHVYRNVERFPHAITIPGVVIVRIDASLNFANVSFLKELLLRQLHARGGEEPVRAVILDAGSVNNLDSSADAALHGIHRELEERGIRLHLAGVKGPVRDVMARSGLSRAIGSDRLHFSVQGAVEAEGAYGIA